MSCFRIHPLRFNTVIIINRISFSLKYLIGALPNQPTPAAKACKEENANKRTRQHETKCLFIQTTHIISKNYSHVSTLSFY